MDARTAEAVGRLEAVAFEGEAYRHVAPDRHPLSGAGARAIGGRWNPRESFTTLYLALERPTVVGEFYRLARRSNRAPQDFIPRRLYRYEVRLTGLLDLRQKDARRAIDLPDSELVSDDAAACQAIGEVAHYLGAEGILAPSAVGTGTVLAVFFDRLSGESQVRDIDYEAWEAPPEQSVVGVAGLRRGDEGQGVSSPGA